MARKVHEPVNWFLLVVFVGVLSFAGAQDGSEDYELVESISISSGLADRTSCVFRNRLWIHGQAHRLDRCTECVCNNGTTTCNIESCPSDFRCAYHELVYVSTEECCSRCPYKMFVEETNLLYEAQLDFTIGDKKKVKFGLDIAVDRYYTSRFIRGEKLWKLGAWISPSENGSGRKFSYKQNVFRPKHATQQYVKSKYPPWQWSQLKYDMDFSGGYCEDFKYFCVQFEQADEPITTYDIDFTFQAVDDEPQRLIGCKALGACTGVGLEDRNPCSFRGQFLTHGEAQRLDSCTECLCRNGTTTCNIESCPPGCELYEIVVIPEECCPQCLYIV